MSLPRGAGGAAAATPEGKALGRNHRQRCGRVGGSWGGPRSVLSEIIDEGAYLPEQIFNVDEAGLYWKRMPDQSYIRKEEKLMPGYKAAKDRLTVVWWQCLQ